VQTCEKDDSANTKSYVTLHNGNEKVIYIFSKFIGLKFEVVQLTKCFYKFFGSISEFE